MPHETQDHISPTELFRAAESVVRSGRPRTVRMHGKTLTIGIQVARESTPRCGARMNGFVAAYGSVPPLTAPLSDTEMTEIAAEEAAREGALAGSPPYARP